MTYAHQYRIEEDYFLRMCMELRWVPVPVYGLLYICKPAAQRFTIADSCIGTYSPRISRTFRTNLVPRLDRRVVPWCNCCMETK